MTNASPVPLEAVTAERQALRPALPAELAADVVVVGAGPAGSATAYWLASAGHNVVVVERKHLPRDKTCGDGLTPRSVHQLEAMGLGPSLSIGHRYDGLRALAFGRELSLGWPAAPGMPSVGYVVTRAVLDELVARRASAVGARVIEGAEVIGSIARPNGLADGPMGGVIVADKDHGGTTRITARYIVVADGANSRLGRAVGAERNRAFPLGMALRGYYWSPRHDERFIESHLDVRLRDGSVAPGYGWIFPVGDGRVNVGVGLLSTDRRCKGVNTSQLFDAFVEHAPASWGLSEATSCGSPTGGKLPMGLSVGPRVGPDYLLVGDAAGSINPFNGEGIAYAYETGRMAAAVLDRALGAEGAGALEGYEALLQQRYGSYYAVARTFVHLISRPELMHRLVGTAMYSSTLMDWVLRIMSNLLRPDELGPGEMAFEAMQLLARRVGVTGVGPRGTGRPPLPDLATLGAPAPL